MKNLLACVAALMVYLSASASVNEKKFYTGGNLGLWYDSSNEILTATILPEFGYNINRAWSIGTQIGYAYTGNEDDDVSLFGISPYVRWKCIKSGIVELFIDGGVDFAFGETTVEYKLISHTYTDSESIATYGLGFKPGIALNVTDQFSLVAHFGFIGYKGATIEGTGINTGFGIDLTNSVNFGFYYKF